MSYLSATENVGFSGIPQTISDASCATQYKMAVEGATANCSEVMYIPDNSTEESSYITHLNDNYYTKFKIDPNELYTFHDSDVIAGEITVSHTEDTFMFSDNVEAMNKPLNSPNHDLDILGAFTNGDIKKEIKKKVLSNGHCTPVSKSLQKETKTSNTKAQKTKGQVKEVRRDSVSEARKQNIQNSKAQPVTVSLSNSKNSINSVNTNNVKPVPVPSKQTGNETFLDVFKREQGVVVNEEIVVKTEPQLPPPVKIPISPPKKCSAKTPSQPKARRGRGPAVHEALQRIPQKAIPIPNRRWHAPGDNLFECGPLDNKILAFRVLESSSSDEDNMPDFESGSGPVCVEETAVESRGARLALRRAALRRHVARAHDTLRLARDYKDQRILASVIKKQMSSQSSSGKLPTPTVNHLLAMRGMPTVLNTRERRKLRESGWSGTESGSSHGITCAENICTRPSLPCARYCLSHVTSSEEQRLYAACAAVFAGGARCRAPLLPLHAHTPLCAEHAWKRDNYDKLLKDNRPRKVVKARLPAAPRRPKRRRRAPPRPRVPAPPTAEQSLSGLRLITTRLMLSDDAVQGGARVPRRYRFTRDLKSPRLYESGNRVSGKEFHNLEINVCSNSSAYDSTEETAMGALSENEYIAVASHELEVEVGHVPADDILDPAVLNQIPDEAFTEFFTQGIVLADGEASFGEGTELEAVLDAVLDERGALDERELDERIDERTLEEQELEESELEMDPSMFNHTHAAVVKGQMQVPVSASVPMEVTSSASS